MAALFCFLPLTAAALGSDREQPIHIQADTVEIDDLKGISVYRGKVTYTQGTIRLEAETVTVYAQEKRFTKVVADGQPAKYSQRLDKRAADLRAEASHIEYYARPERVLLQGDAHLWRDGDEFAGNIIDYDAEQDIVSARKGESGEGRVQVVIQPEHGDAPQDE